MPLHHLEHFLIQPQNLEDTAAWWCDVLGLEEGPHPDFGFPVKWLYIGDCDVVHMTTGGPNVSDARKSYLGQQSAAVYGSGVVDHVAFRCTGLEVMLKHLQKKSVDIQKRRVDDQGLFQLFLLDPNGVKVELNFDADEVTEVDPELLNENLIMAQGAGN